MQISTGEKMSMYTKNSNSVTFPLATVASNVYLNFSFDEILKYSQNLHCIKNKQLSSRPESIKDRLPIESDVQQIT
jgi:hypothetical protein